MSLLSPVLAHAGHPHVGNEWIHHSLEIAVALLAVAAVVRLVRVLRRNRSSSEITSQ